MAGQDTVRERRLQVLREVASIATAPFHEAPGARELDLRTVLYTAEHTWDLPI